MLPGHVAIIMDGNRRWAKARCLPSIMGHNAGVESVKTVVRVAKDIGIKYLTLYAFSSENWKRPMIEVKALMLLLKSVLRKYTDELLKNGVKLMVSGNVSEMDASVRIEVSGAIKKLESGKNLTLNIALNYGGRQEIIDAVNAIIGQGLKKIDSETFSGFLYTKSIPDPDLVIRTSGEMRLSNFLLWQSAYSEFYVTDTFWPDFGREDFIKALLAYQNRDRRFGKN